MFGATLITLSEPSLDHAVVVVKDGSIAAVGSQQMIPIPPGSTKVEAYGKYCTPAAEGGGKLQVGSEAESGLFPPSPTRIPA